MLNCNICETCKIKHAPPEIIKISCPKYNVNPTCNSCPFHDEGDFENNGKPLCRGILDFGYCPYLYTFNGDNGPGERG